MSDAEDLKEVGPAMNALLNALGPWIKGVGMHNITLRIKAERKNEIAVTFHEMEWNDDYKGVGNG